MEISDDLLEINPNLKSQVAYVGKGKHKAVLVDNFYKDLEKILEAIAKLPYTDHYDLTGNFPGRPAGHIFPSLETSLAGRLAIFFRRRKHDVTKPRFTSW